MEMMFSKFIKYAQDVWFVSTQADLDSSITQLKSNLESISRWSGHNWETFFNSIGEGDTHTRRIVPMWNYHLSIQEKDSIHAFVTSDRESQIEYIKSLWGVGSDNNLSLPQLPDY